MNNPIIENILKSTWADELNALEKKLIELSEKAKDINIKIGTGDAAATQELVKIMKQYNDTVQKLADTENKLFEAKRKTTKVTVEERVQTESLNKVTKLEAQASNENVDALTRMNAQQKLAIINYANLSQKIGVTDKELASARGEVMKTTEALMRLNNGTAGTKSGMNNAYNSTYQMTQVMRELPNFAIDARIGLMSLSNNLPMLYDGFAQLAKQVDATTGKAKGWGYAFKTMGASLLSVNTALIVGMSALLMFGDEIGAFFTKLFTGASKTADVFKILKDVIKDGGGSFKTAAEENAKLGAMIDNFNGSTKQSKAIVDKYNETLGKYYGNVTDVNDAISGYVRNSPNYIKAMMAEAVAGKLAEQASEFTMKKIKSQTANARIENVAELRKLYQMAYDEAEKGGSKGLQLLAKWTKKYGGTSGVFAGIADMFKESGNKGLSEAFSKLLDTKNARQFLGNVEDINAAVSKEKVFAEQLASVMKGIPTDLGGEGLAKSTEKTAKAFNMLKLEAEPSIDLMKEIASSDEMSFDDRAKAVQTWAKLRYAVAKEDERVQLDALETEYQEALKTTKDKVKLDEWKAQETKKITLTSRNDVISIEQDAAKMIEGINKDIVKSEDEAAKERLNTINLLLDDEFAAYKEFWDLKNKQQKEQDAKELEQKKLKAEAEKDIIAESFRAASELSDIYFSSQIDKLDSQIKANEAAKDDELQILEDKKNAGLVTEEDYLSEKNAKEAYYKSISENLDRESFELDKRRRQAQIAIDLASSIMNIWTKYSDIPPYAGILTAIVSGVAISQAAAIEAQAYAEGGKLPVLESGMIRENPNVPTRKGGDNILAYVKGGEAILNKTQIDRLGGASALKLAGVPGYEYAPDMRDIGTSYLGRNNQPIIVNSNFDSAEMISKLGGKLDRVVDAIGGKYKLIDLLRYQRHGG